MQSFDPIFLQRLVDGELDFAETKKLLEQAEANPGLWREVASAFVEDQFWKNGMASVEENREPEFEKPASTAATSSMITRWNGSHWFSLAAGVVIALSTGWMIGLFDPPAGVTENVAANAEIEGGFSKAVNESGSSESGMVAGDVQPASLPPDFRMEFEDPNGNSYFAGIPLYDVSTAKKAGFQFENQRRVPHELVNRLQRNGMWLNEGTNYVSGRLNDGRTFVFPVRTISVNPGQ